MTDKIILRFIPNVFEKDIVEIHEEEYRYQTLGTWFDKAIKRDRQGYYPILSGKRASWDEVPGLDDDVVFIQEINGPIVGAIAAIWAAVSAWAAAHTILAIIIGTLVSALLGFAMSFLFAPEVPKDSFASSPTYQWDGIKNIIGEGNVVPVVYGEHRVGGAVIEAWIDGEKKTGRTTLSYLNALMALSEGPIEDIRVNTIKLNSQPLANYKGVHTDTRLGTNNQSPIPEYSQIVRHFNLTGVELRHDTPWTYTLSGDTLNKCVVNITSPALFDADNDDGDMNSQSVFFEVSRSRWDGNAWGAWEAVEGGEKKTGARYVEKEVFVQHYDDYGNPIYDGNGDPVGHYEMQWVWETYEYYVWEMRAASKSTVNYSIPIGFPAAGKYKIQIKRTTSNHSGLKEASNTYVNQIKEVEFGKVGYVNTALLGARIKATDQLSGMMPTISVIIKGRKLRDVRTGEVDFVHSKNPANIIYDLLTHKRYGLGNAFGFSQDQVNSRAVTEFIDMDSLKQFADFCDERVTYTYYDPNHPEANGKGWVTAEAEKRYELNCVLDTPSRAMDLITKLCGTCRALPYWEGSRFKVVIERESQPVQMFTMGNIIYDSYTEDYASIRDIPNIMECYLLDEEDDFQRVAITGMDKKRWSDPTRSKEVNLYGLTRISRAKRELCFAMNKAKSIRKFITFRAGMDAIVCEAGDVFMFQHNIPKYGLAGGNVKGITTLENGKKQVEIDRAVSLVDGKEYCLRVRKNATNAQIVKWFNAPRTEKTKFLEFPADTTFGFSAGDLYAVGEGLNIAFGNIAEIDTDLTRVKIDADVDLKAGRQYSLRVQKQDGSLKVYTFMADSTTTTRWLQLNPGETLNFAVGDIYAFGFMSKEAMPFRLTSLVRKDDRTAEISAEQYISSIFTDDHTISIRKPRRKALGTTEMLTADTLSATLEEPIVTLDAEMNEFQGSQTEPPPLVMDISLTEEVVLVGDVYQSNIVVSFGEVDMPTNSIAKIVRYEVMASRNGGDTWTRDGTCTQGPYRIKNVKKGLTYHVLVKPRTNYNITNHHEDDEDTALSFSIAPTAQRPVALSSPQGLLVTPNDLTNRLTWVNPTDPNFSHVEIWVATANDRAQASLLDTRKGMMFDHGGVQGGTIYYYWLRSVATDGGKSDYFPASATGGVQATFNGITETQLKDAILALGAGGSLGVTGNQFLINMDEENVDVMLQLARASGGSFQLVWNGTVASTNKALKPADLGINRVSPTEPGASERFPGMVWVDES